MQERECEAANELRLARTELATHGRESGVATDSRGADEVSMGHSTMEERAQGQLRTCAGMREMRQTHVDRVHVHAHRRMTKVAIVSCRLVGVAAAAAMRSLRACSSNRSRRYTSCFMRLGEL